MKPTKKKSRKYERKFQNVTVIVSESDLPVSENGVLIYKPKQPIRFNKDEKLLNLKLNEEILPRIRHQKWYEDETTFGKICVMSRPTGAQIIMNLAQVNRNNFKLALETSVASFKNAMSIALVKMDNNLQIKIQENEN